MIRTTEKAATLPKLESHCFRWSSIEGEVEKTYKLDRETNNGVRRVIRCIGITGKGAMCVSTYTNATAKIALATKSPQIRGCDQGSSSVDLRLNPRSSVPTVATKVVEPRTSIRRSFSYVDRFSISGGSLILTFAITRIVDKARTGICIRGDGQRLSACERGRLMAITCTRKADRLEKRSASESRTQE